MKKRGITRILSVVLMIALWSGAAFAESGAVNTYTRTDTAQILGVQPVSADQWLTAEESKAFFSVAAYLDARALFSPENEAEERDRIEAILESALETGDVRITGEGKTVTVFFLPESGDAARIAYNISTRRITYTRGAWTADALPAETQQVNPEEIRKKLESVSRMTE